MRAALDCVNALKQALDGIEETENEMEQVMEHITALEDILSTSKKSPKKDLKNLGILPDLLLFADDKLSTFG
ncbi:hypothetical protein BDW22DRAFT_1486294 [Trametopsis cervina]|nr:hypothetical protein BDW22DRAFT_1486294 [Trametopsis cervina]